ncbi:MAG: hypothetical protein Q8O46_00180 [bacterium]|nr:hypothetical protein [bacterium]
MTAQVNKKKGFVALLSVIIISFILLSAAVTLNFSGFSGRFNILDSEFKERSNALANACVEHARLVLATDSSFIGTGQANVGNEVCDYEILSGGKIKAWATANNAYTYYQAKVNLLAPNNSLTSFEECTELTTCP